MGFCILQALLLASVSNSFAATQSFETSIDYTIHKLATEYNDPSAQYLVGRNYFKGKSVERNVEEAVKWFEMAAKQNHIRAQYQLGKIYLHGTGINKNLNYAFYYLQKAAERNHLESMYELGNYYLSGKPENKQYSKAVKWFEKAAARDHVLSMYALGKLIYSGKGTKQNKEKGKQYLKSAAESGLLEATNYLADLEKQPAIELTQPLVTENSTTDQSSVELSSNNGATNTNPEIENDDTAGLPPDQQYQLAMQYLSDNTDIESIQKATDLIVYAANADHGKAQYQLAKQYKQGIGVKQNGELYKVWLKKAASAGVQSAARDLEAINIEKSLDKSIDQETRDPEGQYRLGLNYYNGSGKDRDHVEAAKWFLKAAKQNYNKAQYQLGLMYEKGIGFEQDANKAKRWYKMAAKSGLKDARLALIDLEKLENQPAKSKPVAPPVNHSSKPVTAVVAQTVVTQTNKKATDNSIKKKDDPLQEQLLSLKSEPIYPLFKNAADGDVTSQYEIGLKYLIGADGLEKNISKAVKWIEIAANNEHTEARLKLGILYLNGVEIDRDYRSAVDWLEKAAYAGHPEAQLVLGDLYKKGLGVDQNSTTAIMWYRKSANQGHVEARKRLGGCRIC